jgi:hypothetical protein
MNRILVESLEMGALPIYDFDVRQHYYEWMAPHWNIRQGGPHRQIVTMDIDEPLTVFIDALRARLEMLRPGHLTNPNGTQEEWDRVLEYHEDGHTCFEGQGTLVLALRSAYAFDSEFCDTDGQGRVPNRHGVFIMGGLAYFPGVQAGEPLGEIDPVYWMEQACLRLAGKEYDHAIPITAYDRPVPPPLTAEDHARHEEMIRRLWRHNNPEVKAKARAILRAHLNARQQEELDHRHQFHVMGGDGHQYVITEKAIHNVFRIVGGERAVEYCLVSEHAVPTFDLMLMQKLLLEADPAHFHRVANQWDLREDERKRVYFDPTTFEVRGNPPTLPPVIRRLIDQLHVLRDGVGAEHEPDAHPLDPPADGLPEANVPGGEPAAEPIGQP